MYFLEFPCFFYDLVDVGNLPSCSSAFSSLYTWKISFHILQRVNRIYQACSIDTKPVEFNPVFKKGQKCNSKSRGKGQATQIPGLVLLAGSATAFCITLHKSFLGASTYPSSIRVALKPPPRNGRNLQTIGLENPSEIFQCSHSLVQ